MQGVGAWDLFVAMVTGDVAIAVELELEKFGKGVEERCLGHCSVGGALQNNIILLLPVAQVQYINTKF